MGSLAGLLQAAGHDVRGSDEHVYPPMSTQLAEQADPGLRGLRARRTSTGAPDRVVVGNVCRRDHVEVLAAQERKIPLTLVPRAAVASCSSSDDRVRWWSPGTHGKTTTSSLMAHVLWRRRARSRRS